MNFISVGRYLVDLGGPKVILCVWSNGADTRLIGGIRLEDHGEDVERQGSAARFVI